MPTYSLQTLLETLENCDGDYVGAANGIQLGAHDFDGFTNWESDAYTRNCIVRTDAYELILICWSEGQITPVHCHGGEECWVYMVDGQIEETRFEDDDNGDIRPVHSMSLTEGKITYMNDEMGYHKLHNVNTGRSMSLHLYANPIDACRVYSDETGKFELRKLQDFSYAGSRL